ncbi:MAG: MFS transporter, partial [Pseudomonas sp.]
MMLKNLLVLVVALLMFPQIAQTLYSPALADIGQAFAVGPEAAGQTLSVY